MFGTYGYRRNLRQSIRPLVQECDCAIIHGLWQYHTLVTWALRGGTGVPYFVYPHGMLDPWFKSNYHLNTLRSLVIGHGQIIKFSAMPQRYYSTEQDGCSQGIHLVATARERVVGYGTTRPPCNIERQRAVFFDHFLHLRGKRILLFLSRIIRKRVSIYSLGLSLRSPQQIPASPCHRRT